MNKDSRQGHFKGKRNLLIGLVCLIILGVGSLSFLVIRGFGVQRQPRSSSHSPFSTNSTIMMSGFDAQNTSYNPGEHIINSENVSRLVPYWIASTLPHLLGTVGPPAVINGIAYFTSGDYTISAYEAKTGKELWISRIGGLGFPPAVANGVVYVGSGTGYLYAFDAKTGVLLWRAQYSEGIPIVADGVIYVDSADNNLYAFNPKTGAILWKTNIGLPNPFNPRAAVTDGIVYVSSAVTLYAIDAKTGDRLWSFATKGYLSSPTVVDGIVYVGSGNPDGKLYALDVKTGTVLWIYLTVDDAYSHIDSPAVANGVVYISGGWKPGYIYALNAKTGTLLWTFTSPSDNQDPIMSAPFVANGVVYVDTDYPGRLYALNAKTGTSLWTFVAVPGYSITSEPLVVNGVVYVGAINIGSGSSDTGKLYALHLPNDT